MFPAMALTSRSSFGVNGLEGTGLNLVASRSWNASIFGSLKTSIVATFRVWEGSATGPGATSGAWASSAASFALAVSGLGGIRVAGRPWPPVAESEPSSGSERERRGYRSRTRSPRSRSARIPIASTGAH